MERNEMVFKVRVKTVDEVKVEALAAIEFEVSRRGWVGNEAVAELKEVARDYGASFAECLAAVRRGAAQRAERQGA
jgi:hypothetical protein